MRRRALLLGVVIALGLYQAGRAQVIERFFDFVMGQPQITPSGAEMVPLLPPGGPTKRGSSLSIASLLLSLANTWTAGQACTPEVLVDQATITPDLNQCNVKTVTLGGNRTLGNPADARAGFCGQIFIKQDTTGGRTLTFASDWKFSGGSAPTLSTAAGATDVLSFCTRDTGFIAAQLLANVQ